MDHSTLQPVANLCISVVFFGVLRWDMENMVLLTTLNPTTNKYTPNNPQTILGKGKTSTGGGGGAASAFCGCRFKDLIEQTMAR